MLLPEPALIAKPCETLHRLTDRAGGLGVQVVAGSHPVAPTVLASRFHNGREAFSCPFTRGSTAPLEYRLLPCETPCERSANSGYFFAFLGQASSASRIVAEVSGLPSSLAVPVTAAWPSASH
jgi:hypothetical protein